MANYWISFGHGLERYSLYLLSELRKVSVLSLHTLYLYIMKKNIIWPPITAFSINIGFSPNT